MAGRKVVGSSAAVRSRLGISASFFWHNGGRAPNCSPENPDRGPPQLGQRYGCGRGFWGQLLGGFCNPEFDNLIPSAIERMDPSTLGCRSLFRFAEDRFARLFPHLHGNVCRPCKGPVEAHLHGTACSGNGATGGDCPALGAVVSLGSRDGGAGTDTMVQSFWFRVPTNSGSMVTCRLHAANISAMATPESPQCIVRFMVIPPLAKATTPWPRQTYSARPIVDIDRGASRLRSPLLGPPDAFHHPLLFENYPPCPQEIPQSP